MNKCPYCKQKNSRNRMNSKSNIYQCKQCNKKYSSKFNFIKYLIYMILISSIAFVFLNFNADIFKEHEWWVYIYFITLAVLAGFFSEDYVQLDES